MFQGRQYTILYKTNYIVMFRRNHQTIVAVVVACPLSERSYNCGRVLCESENKQSIIEFSVVRGFDCLASELYSLIAQR